MASISRALRELLFDSVSSSIEQGKPVGIAFSGGIDSSLLSKICSDLKADLTLLTVGFPGASDLEFSRLVAGMMGFKHRTGEINEPEFEDEFLHVSNLIPCRNTSHLENCIAYRHIAKLARQNGIDKVISANGLDELFCGYDSYRTAFDLGGEEAVHDMMEQKLTNENELVAEIRTVAGELGVRVDQPFLSQTFSASAREIPVSEKIHGGGDLLRKHVLRKVAIEIGVPEVAAMRPKKALQYGSLIHKNFKKARHDFFLRSASDE